MSMFINNNGILKRVTILSLVFLLLLTIVSSPVYANSDSIDEESPAEDTSKYIGTVFHEGVPVLTAGGGYKFYTDAECENIAVGGSHEIIGDKPYSLYIKANTGYEVTSVQVKYPNGLEAGAYVSQHNDVYQISISTDAQLLDDLAIHVDVRLTSTELLDVNFALVEWKSKGESGTLAFTFNDKNYIVNDAATYTEAYNDVFAQLWARAEHYSDITTQINLNKSQTKIWKVSGNDNVLYEDLIIRTGSTVIFLCEENATIKASNKGKITLAGGILGVQGKDHSATITFDGEAVYRTANNLSQGTTYAIDNASRENLFQLRFGKAYFEHVNVKNVYSKNDSTGTQGGALQILPYTGTDAYKNKTTDLYVTDMTFTDCRATSGGAFGSNTANVGSEIYFYQTTFDACQTSRSMNNVGGGAVRAGGGSGLYTFYKCYFVNNKLAHTGSSADKGYNAGGAVRWNIGANDLYTGVFNGCTFEGNTSVDRGGAIFTTGSLQLNACILAKNSAKNSGGAVFVAAHSQNTAIKNPPNLDGSVVFGRGTKIYNNKVENAGTDSVDGGGLGGAIHFKVGISKAGDANIRENYELYAMVSGAEIYNNEAARGGGIAVSVTYNYDCGVYVYEGSSIHGNKALKDGGAVYIESDSEYGRNHGVTIEGGTISNNTAVRNGGAVYLQKGNVTMSGGSLANNTANQNGGAVYLGGGNLTVSGGAISANRAQNGAGALVANGEVIVTGGVITRNTATQNGGGIAVTNGDFIMTGGQITENTTVLDGGGIYVSSTDKNAQIIIRSGEITDNHAGNSGGAVGVHGQDGVTFTITIGSNTLHTAADDHHKHDGVTEACPVVERNTSVTSGGGVYLSGSYSAQMNVHCLIEQDNKVGTGETLGISASNFMKVEGGTLLISTKSGDNDNCGNVVINSSVHVTGGSVTIEGSASNPLFMKSVTVDVDKATGAIFTDNRTPDNKAYTIQYFENVGGGDAMQGRYFFVDVCKEGDLDVALHEVQVCTYQNSGFVFDGWERMKKNGTEISSAGEDLLNAGVTVSVTENFIFYAKWKPVAITIQFLPNATAYKGSMPDQNFSYTESATVTLNLNQYVNYGNRFLRWKQNGTDKTYIDGDSIEIILSGDETEAVTIVLVAQWEDCTHRADEMLPTVADQEQAILTRQCKCLGYMETVALTGVNVPYDGTPHGATCKHTVEPQNETAEAPLWSVTIVYAGTSYGGVAVDPNTPPINAGEYQAGITVDEQSVSVAVIINKAQQDPPSAPKYEIKDAGDGINHVITVTPPANIEAGKVLQYQIWWYVGTELQTDGQLKEWSNNDPLLAPWMLSKDFTNYYVEVRYKGDDNHNPSAWNRGIKLFFQSGKVILEITEDLGIDVSWGTSENSGIDITVRAEEGFYLYDVEMIWSANDADYVLLPHGTSLSFQYSDGIASSQMNIPTRNEADPVTVVIHFTGAKKKATVETTTVKDQAFGNIGQSGPNAVAISRDSAYTILFSVQYYEHYSVPTIEFSSALPAGTTVILVDHGVVPSYWSYTASAFVTEIPLSSFKRMGDEQGVEFAIGNRTSFSLQFVVDFSRCQTPPERGNLRALLTATPQHPEGLDTIPVLPTTGFAVSTITLEDAPVFQISPLEPSGELIQNIQYKYAAGDNYGPDGDSVGISKWDGLRGILLVTPTGTTLTNLPPDITMEVKIDEHTENYPLINGRFVVALPADGTGVASMKLLSDMLPEAKNTFEFTVTLVVSATMVKTTPTTLINQTMAGSLEYQIEAVAQGALSAEIRGDLPEYHVAGDQVTIEPIEFKGRYSVIGTTDYTVRAALYIKNNQTGVYTYTSVTTDDKASNHTITLADGNYSGSLDLNALKDTMSTQVGSLSLMLRVEIVDSSGKVLDKVSLYFVLIDTRETK